MQTPSDAGECGGGEVDVQKNGVDVVNPATTLNFTGSGVTVTNEGNGVAEINISGGGGGGGVDVENQGVPLVNNPVTTIDFQGGITATAVGGSTALIVVTPAVIFDGGGSDENLRSARATEQSPINNAKKGIVNLSSQSGDYNPGATGATDNWTTISGGDDNTASLIGSTVIGGAGNTASGTSFGFAIAGGLNSNALGDGSVALGADATAAIDYSVAFSLATTTFPAELAIGGSFNGSWLAGPVTSIVLMSGSTAGVAADESVELTLTEGAAFSVPAGKAYTIEVTVMAFGLEIAVPNNTYSRGFSFKLNVSNISNTTPGVTTIDGMTGIETFGDAAVADWQFVPSIGTSPDRIVFTFSSGAIAVQAACLAKIAFTGAFENFG